MAILSKPDPNTLSQQEYNEQMNLYREQRALAAPQEYYNTIKERSARIVSNIKKAPRAVGRGSQPRRISLGNENKLERAAYSRVEAEQASLLAEQESGLMAIEGKEKAEAVKEFKSAPLEDRYAAGDPNVKVVSAYNMQRFLEDTGERYNGEIVYRAHTGQKFIGLPKISDELGFGGGKFFGTEIYNGKIIKSVVGPGSRGTWERKELGSYSPTSKVELKYEPWGYESIGVPEVTSGSAMQISKTFHGSAERKGYVSDFYGYNVDSVNADNRAKYSYTPTTTRDPSKIARQDVLMSGRGTATFKEISAKPSLLSSLPKNQLPIINTSWFAYGQTGKAYTNEGILPFAKPSYSFEERTGFSEENALIGGISLKLGGEYNTSEIANAFMGGKQGESLSVTAARMKEENVVTGSATVPVTTKAGPFKVESYSPTKLFMGESRGDTDLNYASDVFQGLGPVNESNLSWQTIPFTEGSMNVSKKSKGVKWDPIDVRFLEDNGISRRQDVDDFKNLVMGISVVPKNERQSWQTIPFTEGSMNVSKKPGKFRAESRGDTDLNYASDVFQGNRPVSDLFGGPKKAQVKKGILNSDDFAMVYGEPTAGDVLTKLNAEGKNIKDINRVRELALGSAGIELEQKKKEIRGGNLPKELKGGFLSNQEVRERENKISKLDLDFYTNMGSDFLSYESKISTPEREKRVKELESLRKQIDVQSRKKIDGKSIIEFSNYLKSKQNEVIKAGDEYKNYLNKLGDKNVNVNEFKKAEVLFDNAKTSTDNYNSLVNKYMVAVGPLNNNVEKLKDYEDIARQEKIKYGTEKKIIDKLDETRNYLIENEPKLIDSKINLRFPSSNNEKDNKKVILANKMIDKWNVAVDQINTIPKTAFWKPEVREYQTKEKEYGELISTLERIETGHNKKQLSKSASDKLYYLSTATGIPTGYDVAEGILSTERGKGAKASWDYFFSGKGGLLKRGISGFGRAGLLLSAFQFPGKGTDRVRENTMFNANISESTALYFKPTDLENKGIIDTQKALLSENFWVRQVTGKTYAYVKDTGKTQTEYLTDLYSPKKGVKAKASKAFKLTLGDPGVVAVGATAFAPALFFTYGGSSLPFLLTTAQTPVGKAASELTRGFATVGGEQISVEGTKGFEKISGINVKHETKEKIKNVGGIVGSVGSFAVPGRYQAALMGLNTEEIKKAPVQSATLVATGAAFKGLQSYGSAWKWEKLVSPSYGKLLQEKPIISLGSRNIGKADLYKIGLTAPGTIVTAGLGSLYLGNIGGRIWQAETRSESRKITTEVEKEFTLLGLGGQIISSSRPVAKWENKAYWDSVLSKNAPYPTGKFRKPFGGGTTTRKFAKEMELMEEPKSFNDQFLQLVGLQKQKAKPEAKQLIDLFIKEGYIKSRGVDRFGLAKARDNYRPTVAKIMKEYGKYVYMKGSKVGGEQIVGFRKTAKSDYDLIFTGPKNQYIKFKNELAKAMIKKNPDLIASFTTKGKLILKTQSGRDVVNLQQSSVKIADKDILTKDGIRMLKVDKWIKDKYNIVKFYEKQKTLTSLERAKLKKAKADIKSYEGTEFITTPKGLKEFELSLTMFEKLYSTTKYPKSPNAKYKIKPEEIKVFEKDQKPWEVLKEATILFKGKLGGSSIRLHYLSTGERAISGVPKPNDIDIYVKDVMNYRKFVTKELIKKGYKLIPETKKITSKNEFKVVKSESGFDIRLKDGGVQVHNEGMLMKNLYSVGPTSPFKSLFKTTPEGYKIPRYELQARRELYGVFADSRASKDLPKFITGQRALGLEGKNMVETKGGDLISQFLKSKKTAGRSTEFLRKSQVGGWNKFSKDFEKLNIELLPQSKQTLKLNLAQRKELSNLPDIMKLVTGKGLIKSEKVKVKTSDGSVTYKVVPKLHNPIKGKRTQLNTSKTKLLEGYGDAYKEVKYKPYNIFGIISKGYGYPKKYNKYPSYTTYKYKPYKSYDVAKNYKDYNNYDLYTPYTSYSSYTPYTPPYTPYTPYTSYSPYGSYNTYQTYKPTTPTTTPAKPGLPWGGGGQRPFRKGFKYSIKTFGVLELEKEFNKKNTKPLISDFKMQKFKIL